MMVEGGRQKGGHAAGLWFVVISKKGGQWFGLVS